MIRRGRRPRRITPSDIPIILHMVRKPNLIIVLLFLQNNSQFKNNAKTCLPPSMLSSSSIVHLQGCSAPQIFSKQQMSPLEASSCCSFHVFSSYFAQFLLLKRGKCPPFLFSQPKQLNLVPRSSRLTVHSPVAGCIFDVISSVNTIFSKFGHQ